MANDEDDRTTALGLFNFAESFYEAATALNRTRRKTVHRESPLYFLYYHAIELYLKAYLRFHGYTAKQLRVNFSHGYAKLRDAAVAMGLQLDPEDEDVIKLMETDIVIRSRYIQTGFFRWPTKGFVDGTCDSLRSSVGAELKKGGVSVRLGRWTHRNRKRASAGG